MKKIILNFLKIVIFALVLMLIMILIVKGFTNDNEEKIKIKTNQELVYFENKLISIANKINNISFGHYSISESKIDDNIEESLNENNNKQEKNSSANNNEDKETSSVESQKDNEKSNRDKKLKFELKQDSTLTSNEKKVDWDYIKLNSELLYSNWAQLLLDLNSLDVDDNKILEFSNIINDLIMSVKEENKAITLRNISRLYSYIPKFNEQITDERIKINIEYTKYCVLSAYCLLEENNWDKIKENIDFAKEYFLKIINSIDNNDENNQRKFSRVYILINELDNCIDIKDKDIFYIKYKLLMNDLTKL